MPKKRIILFVATASQVLAFQSTPAFHPRGSTRLFSSTGGLPPPPPPSGKNSPEFDDFLNPKRKESESLRLAREYMSEENLPISFGAAEQKGDDSVSEVMVNDEADELTPLNLTIGSGVTAGAKTLLDGPSAAMLANNPYMMVVSNLAPSDLISKFTTTAHPRVQNAVRATILGLIGNLPKLAFDTKTITTGQRLASLMFQLQMTGYMFKNAEYRLSLSQSLGMNSNPSIGQSSSFLLAGSEDDDDNDEEDNISLDGTVKGKIKIRYGGSNDKSNDEDGDKDPIGGFEMEVDAAAFTSELRSEVTKLRDELMIKRQEKSEALRKDLLLYIRTLPEKELKSLTTTITEDVLVAMKGLVNVVMSGIGDDEIGPDTVTEQSGEAMAQLCMWQLVVGYNLRELEVRQQMKNSLMSKSDDVDGGIEFSGPGVME